MDLLTFLTLPLPWLKTKKFLRFQNFFATFSTYCSLRMFSLKKRIETEKNTFYTHSKQGLLITRGQLGSGGPGVTASMFFRKG